MIYIFHMVSTERTFFIDFQANFSNIFSSGILHLMSFQAKNLNVGIRFNFQIWFRSLALDVDIFGYCSHVAVSLKTFHQMQTST